LLEWRNGEAEIESYLTPRVTENAPNTLNEAAEELDSLMRQSVTEQMDADMPLGIWLSGGLDSSTILHYASEASTRPLKTFSITFNGRSFNDGDFIQEVSNHYGSEHTELNLDGDCDLVGTIQDISYHADEPNADAGAVPLWFLSKMTRQHVTVSHRAPGSCLDAQVCSGWRTPAARLRRQNRPRIQDQALP
jgi:asparagine synthase (glutamine-hydrolysing)